MILLSHPTGNQNVRQTALALAEAGLLEEFWTCLDWQAGSLLDRLLPQRATALLGRRTFPPSLRGQIRTQPWREAARLACLQLGLHRLTHSEAAPFSIERVIRSLDHQVARHLQELPRLTGVYAYEDGAADTFARAADLGLQRIYDLPTGYWQVKQQLLDDEATREPEWADTLRGRTESPAKLERKEREIDLAETIIAPSTFVSDSLATKSRAAHKTIVIPFGSPPVADLPKPKPARNRLRVIYVGTVGQQKGIAYLLRAVAASKSSVELTVIGRPAGDPDHLPREAMRGCRWLKSLPHAEVLAEMSRHDVLVFPTLFDGFGLVILEAMSQGLPVITTPNCAGPDLIQPDREGFIVPIRSPESISEKLEFLAGNRGVLGAMAQAARETARRLTWAGYRERLLAAVVATLYPEAAP